MFKERFFIFREFLPIVTGPSRRPKNRVYRGGELPPEVREKEKKHEEESIKVAEHIISNLEQYGIKCDRCGSKNTRQVSHDDYRINLECFDCKFRWSEDK